MKNKNILLFLFAFIMFFGGSNGAYALKQSNSDNEFKYYNDSTIRCYEEEVKVNGKYEYYYVCEMYELDSNGNKKITGMTNIKKTTTRYDSYDQRYYKIKEYEFVVDPQARCRAEVKKDIGSVFSRDTDPEIFCQPYFWSYYQAVLEGDDPFSSPAVDCSNLTVSQCYDKLPSNEKEDITVDSSTSTITSFKSKEVIEHDENKYYCYQDKTNKATITIPENGTIAYLPYTFLWCETSIKANDGKTINLIAMEHRPGSSDDQCGLNFRDCYKEMIDKNNFLLNLTKGTGCNSVIGCYEKYYDLDNLPGYELILSDVKTLSEWKKTTLEDRELVSNGGYNYNYCKEEKEKLNKKFDDIKNKYESESKNADKLENWYNSLNGLDIHIYELKSYSKYGVCYGSDLIELENKIADLKEDIKEKHKDIIKDSISCRALGLMESDTFQLLGDVLQFALYAVPVLVVVFGIKDMASAVLASDEKQMKQEQGKLIKRIIVGVFMMLIPTIVNVLLNIIDITNSCTLK